VQGAEKQQQSVGSGKALSSAAARSKGSGSQGFMMREVRHAVVQALEEEDPDEDFIPALS
jgi:hypothetical protein